MLPLRNLRHGYVLLHQIRFQLASCPLQHGSDAAAAHAQLFRDFTFRRHKPVPTNKYKLFFFRELPDKSVNGATEFPVLNLLFQIVAGGNTLIQFFQSELRFAAAALFRRTSDDLGQGEVARDPSEEGTEPIRAFVWHGVPGTHPGVLRLQARPL